MRIIIILTWLLCCAFPYDIFGNEIISPNVYCGSRNVGICEIYEYEMPLVFSTESSSIASWEISAINCKGDYETLYTSELPDSLFPFDPTLIVWENMKAEFSEEIYGDVYQVQLNCILSDGNSEMLRFKIALSPSKPLITEISYNPEIHSLDPDSGLCWLDGLLKFVVTSQRAQKINMYVSGWHRFPGDISDIEMWELILLDGLSPLKITWEADWGQYVCIEAVNEYGRSRSDRIFTTDHIEDENIRSLIYKYIETQVSNVDKIDEDALISVNVGNHGIKFSDVVKSAYLYTFDGKMIGHYENINEIEMSDVPHGIYIINGMDGANRKYIRKIKL